jgi:exodeoxyribonuclease V gamma subunit
VVAPVARQVQTLIEKTAGLRGGAAEAVDVTVDLGDGSRLSGTVPGVHGERVVRVEYSRLSAKHRIRSWVHVLALAAGRPGHDWCAATVGRGRDEPTMSALVAPGQLEAREVLATLVALYRAGLRRPLPLAPKASDAYADLRWKGSSVASAQAKAGQEWRRTLGDGREIGEFDDHWHQRVWGKAHLTDLLAVGRAVTGEPFDDEPHRFGQLARHVFEPLLQHETRHR